RHDHSDTCRHQDDQHRRHHTYLPASLADIEVTLMCRNIKTLFNFEPPATEEEVRAASLQFVRKVCGFNKPSKANEAAFDAAVDQIAAAAGSLLSSLQTNAPPRDRIQEARSEEHTSE